MKIRDRAIQHGRTGAGIAREVNMSRAQWPGKRAHSFARLAAVVRDAAPANADIGFGLLLLFTWQVTSIAVRPKHLAPIAVLTLFLLVSARLALGKSVWLRRVAWLSPRRGFWLYSLLAGIAVAVAVWAIATSFRQRLGMVPPPYEVLLASSSGAMLEELISRGFLYWLLFYFVDRVGLLHRQASAITVLALALAFAVAHTGRTGVSMFTTVLTGVAYGWMRVQSGSTAAAALMHGTYNLAISCIAAF
jgi:membrane protease YdiL (CAAX protease family)